MDSSWDNVELPVLEVLVGMEEAGRVPINSADVAGAIQMSPERLGLALGRLIQAGYVSGTAYRQGNQPPSTRPDYLDLEVLERGLRATGAWPPAAAPS